MALLAAVLGEDRPKQSAIVPAPGWLGAYIEPETGLAARIDAGPAGQVRLRYGHRAELLDLHSDGTASNRQGTKLRQGDGGLWMDRPHENQSSRLHPCDGTPATDMAGRYRCEELDAELTIADAKPVQAAPGQAFFMKKGTPHGFRNTGSTTAAVMEVFVPAQH